MPDRSGRRRYPRTARVNELVREVLGTELERLSDIDERLLMATITHVEVSSDFSHATVMLSSLSEAAEQALVENRVRLQRAIGRQVRLKRTPLLGFAVDPAIESGQRVEAILRGLDIPPDVEEVCDAGD
ncbi:MAG TPA: 30S ribosome-binding factor RbfA [Acidimicrobiales bacterium]|nr:30S ribosome-binding factor RbfA [Acidimicrobiales bacterium]